MLILFYKAKEKCHISRITIGEIVMSSSSNPIENVSITLRQSDREEWKVGEGIGIDYVLFLLNEEGRLSHPNGIVFFNQSTDTKTGISMEDRGSDIVFSIDLERIRQDSALHSIVDSLLFVAVIDEKCSKTGRDLQVKEIIALKDNAPEPKILEDEYEGFDENRTIFSI